MITTRTLPIFCNKFTQISISANCLAIVARTTNPLTCLLVFRCSQPQPKSKRVRQKGFGWLCGLKRGMICLDFKINLGDTYFISHDQAVLTILLFNTRDIWPALVSEHRTMLHILSEGQKGRTQRPRGILNAIKKIVCIHTHTLTTVRIINHQNALLQNNKNKVLISGCVHDSLPLSNLQLPVARGDFWWIGTWHLTGEKWQWNWKADTWVKLR